MNFAEQPPSTEWAALKYRGEELAEVWLKPEGEPFGLTFRIPQKSFQLPGVGRRLTTESLLKAVGIAAEDVASWRHGDVSHAATDGPDAWESPGIRRRWLGYAHGNASLPPRQPAGWCRPHSAFAFATTRSQNLRASS